MQLLTQGHTRLAKEVGLRQAGPGILEGGPATQLGSLQVQACRWYSTLKPMFAMCQLRYGHRCCQYVGEHCSCDHTIQHFQSMQNYPSVQHHFRIDCAKNLINSRQVLPADLSDVHGGDRELMLVLQMYISNQFCCMVVVSLVCEGGCY